MPRKKCKVCNKKIKVMCQQGTEYCSGNCEKRDTGKPVADDA